MGGSLMLAAATVLSTAITSLDMNNVQISQCNKCASFSVDTTNGYCSTTASTTEDVYSAGGKAVQTIQGTVDDLLNNNFGPFTFIIVGGGTSGCVLASRLSENPNHSVLLIEAGTNDTVSTSVPADVPAFACTNLNYGDFAQCSENYGQAMNNKAIALFSGKGFGGSSNTANTIYNRGFREAFDEWANFTSSPQYSAVNMEKYFLKSESAKLYNMDADYHACNGTMPVRNAWYSPAAQIFEQACRTKSIHVGDYNGQQQVACGRLQYYQNNGRRVNTCQAYLNRALKRPNLTILLKTKVTRIIMDTTSCNITKAVGVEFCVGVGVETVMASKEVIVAAGALRSPQLLLLSGIGNSTDLQEAGIPCVSERNVGYNLYDTIAYAGILLTSDKITETEAGVCYSNSYDQCHDGPSTLPYHFTAIGSFDSSTSVLVQEFNPFSGYGAQLDTVNVDRLFATAYTAGFQLGDIDKTSFMMPVLTRPWSRGVVKLNSSCPYGRPIIDARYYDDCRDKRLMIDTTKSIISMIRSTSTYKLENAKFYDYPIPGCDCLESESDDYYECAMKHLTISIFNYGGTNKMGPQNDPDSVVDGNCNVYGVNGLRVVDASVLPFGMGTTQNQAVVIALAELMADFINNKYSC